MRKRSPWRTFIGLLILSPLLCYISSAAVSLYGDQIHMAIRFFTD
jgi:hypothetical protein